MRVACLLEFETLLGGERSWLAALPHLEGVEPLAVARPEGPLAEILRERGIAHLPFYWPRGEPESRAGLLAPLLRGAGCGLVHGNSLTTSLCASLVADDLGLPGVGHCRDIMTLSRARVQRLNRLGRIIAVSRAAAEGLRAQGVREDLVSVCPNGVDAEGEFNPAAAEDRLHAELKIPRSVPVVGFVGQLVRRKDPATFLEAFARVAKRVPDAQAVVVGARHSAKAEAAAYEAKLRREAAARVVFLGERADVPSLLRGMSVVVNTSRREPLSRVVLEALAMERPVVATDVDGTREILVHERTGLLVPQAAPEATANAIHRLLREPTLGRRLGAEGRRRVLERFTPQQCAAGILRVYKDLLPRFPVQ